MTAMCSLHTCRNATHIETVLYHSVGPATFKPRDGGGLCVVNPMNQVNQYAEVSSQYTEIGELEDRQGRETALNNDQCKDSNHSKVGALVS